MPSYPAVVGASLLSCGNQSCGTLTGELEYDGTYGDEYIYTGGDFAYAYIERVQVSGSVYTWKMTIVYLGAGSCHGSWVLQRTVNDDDPTGDYYGLNGGTPDSNISTGTVVEV